MTDQLQRFIFDNTDIRGEITRLDASYRDTLSNHQYPPVVAGLLGEFLCAAALMSTTIKFEGTLTLQARGEGEIPLIMAEADSDQNLRAIARDADQAKSADFQTLLGKGQLSISITPKQGQRYQGIVPLEGNSLAQCLEAYFQQSEQLRTRLWLHSNGEQAAGMLLQELPQSEVIDRQQRQAQWEHLSQLTDTVTADELFSLPFEQLLHRLYHQEALRLFPPAELRFQCSCSQQRMLAAMRSLGETELLDILEERGSIEITCEFCHQQYRFTRPDIRQLFQKTLH